MLPCSIRPHVAEDAAGVARFHAEVHALDDSISAPSEAAWRAFIAQRQNAGGRDFAVAESGGALCAVLASGRLEVGRHFRIVVHPRFRRRGVGTALLRVVEGQNAEARQPLNSNCRGCWQAGRAFLARHGFAVVHRDLLMHRGAGEVPEAPLPPGYVVRPHRGAADHAAWAALNNEAFADAFYFAAETAKSVGSYAGASGFGLWLAEHEGHAVGFCHVEHFGAADGLIHTLAVTARHRGRGVAGALLLAGTRELLAAGRRRIELSVAEDNPRARALYGRAGFVAYDEVLNHRRPVS